MVQLKLFPKRNTISNPAIIGLLQNYDLLILYLKTDVDFISLKDILGI